MPAAALKAEIQEDLQPHRARVIYFGHDRTDRKVTQRINGLAALGFDVVALTFHREKYDRDHRPTWFNIDLGRTVDYGYAQRLFGVASAAWRVWRCRRQLQAAGFVIARNIDMVVLALFARWVARCRAPLAYEVLDVHRFFIGDSLLNRLFRELERYALARSDLLLVSSPAYIRHYFEPMQRYRGQWFLLENKVSAGRLRRPSARRPPQSPGDRWVIGWCGTLRCVRSLELLIEIARYNRDRVTVYMRGFPTETGLEVFERSIASEPNMIYGGGYRSPDDLTEVYGKIDINWCLDFYDERKNSLWLLPNRLYEGGFFNTPALGLAGTETARKIADAGLGWVLDEPVADSAGQFLAELTPDAYASRVAHLETLPDHVFADSGDLARLGRILLDCGHR